MKRLSVIFITLMVFGLISVSESQAGRFEKRYSGQHDRTDHQRAWSMYDGHFSGRKKIRFEHKQQLDDRHNYRMRHNDTNRGDRDCYDDVSIRRSTVVIPLLFPPLPPPLLLPGMHIRIFSSR